MKKSNWCFKRLKDSEKKQIHADDYENKFLISKEREIFKDIYNKRLDKIEQLDKKNWLWWFNIYYQKQKQKNRF